MTSRLTKNVRKKLFSYFDPRCVKSPKIAYMHICYKTNRPKFLSVSSKSGPKDFMSNYSQLKHKFVMNTRKITRSLHSERMVFLSHFMYMYFWVSYDVTFRKSYFLKLCYFLKKVTFQSYTYWRKNRSSHQSV